MISETIVRFLKSNKRLVIPSMGAFLRKEGEDKVVFVEFLKTDDGVLNAELCRTYSLTPDEATEAIGQFTARVQQMAATPSGFVVPGLGAIRIDANSVYSLEYNPSATATPTTERPTITTPRPTASSTPQPAPPPLPETPRHNEPATESLWDESPKKEPELKGMRYQKPSKPHVDERKKKADLIMVIAIAAAAIAILAMVYGMLTEKSQKESILPPTEQVAPDSLQTGNQ